MYKDCKYDFDKNVGVSGIIVPYNNNVISKLKPIPKEEIAASVFNQILKIKNLMRQDLAHRLKCLS